MNALGTGFYEDVLQAGLANAIYRVLDKIDLGPEGRKYVLACIDCPSRRPQSGIKNVSGIFPSTKVGLSIHFESRTLELSEILAAESDVETIAYFDQAPAIKIAYRNARGRQSGYLQRPDFIRIYKDRIVIRECKSVEELEVRAKRTPELFVKSTNGQWRCPPAEKAAAEMGLTFELVTEADLNPVRTRNMRLLLGYTQTANLKSDTSAHKAILSILQKHKRIQLRELCELTQDEATIDDIYQTVAQLHVCANLDEEWLGDRVHCYLYADETTKAAYEKANSAIASSAEWLKAKVLDLAPGASFTWDGRIWRIANLGKLEVVLVDGDVVQTLPRAVFDTLLKEGRFKASEFDRLPADIERAESYRLIQAATPKELAKAVQVHSAIQPHLQGTTNCPTTRNERRALRSWRAAEAAFGNGFVGLLPHFSRCGNRTPRLQKEVIQVVSTQVDEFYANPKRMPRIRVFERVAHDCKLKGLQVPSYGWFCTYLKKRPTYDMVLAREGRRAAYRYEDRAEPNADIVSHRADWVFEKCYVDHTQVDVETRCSSTSKLLGRPWLTTVVDDHTADVLAYYLTYDPPSYRSVLMVLRDCVKRHGRLPEVLVVDGGKEFQSVWFEATAAYFGMTIIRRPAAKARFGSRGERSFGTINTNFLHTLLGNTQVRKNVRQITPEVDPSNLAVWSYSHLVDAFEQYFEEYRNLTHRELLLSPLELHRRSQETMGDRSHRRVAYDEDFLICTCPTTTKGLAKVQPDGVKINYLYYSAPPLRNHLGKKVPVRFEPLNMAIAYALLNGEWVTLRSRFFPQIKGRSERELIVAREEYFKRRGDVETIRLSDKKLVEFLLKLDAMEEMQIEHHKTLAMRNAVTVQPASAVDDEDDQDQLNSQKTQRIERRKSAFDLAEHDYIECEAN